MSKYTMLGPAKEEQINYLKAFEIDAQDWTYEQAATLEKFLRPGDANSPEPQPRTNPLAKAYQTICALWMDKYVKVKGSENPQRRKGIRGKVISIRPRRLTVPLEGTKLDASVLDPRYWNVVVLQDNGAKTQPSSLAGIEEIAQAAVA